MKLLSELSNRRNELREPDVISNVTSPWMWVLLVGFTVCMAAVVYWAFFGTLIDSVTGSGIVVRDRGISSITAKSSEADKRKNELIDHLVTLMKQNRDRIQELVEMQRKLSEKGITTKVDHYNVLSENVSNVNQLAKMLLCGSCRARAHAAGNLYGPDPEMCAYFKKGERALFESRPQVSGVAARE